MASHDYAGLIDACSRLGDASRGGDPQLWTVVLEHLTQQEEDVTQQVGRSSRHSTSGGLCLFKSARAARDNVVQASTCLFKSMKAHLSI